MEKVGNITLRFTFLIHIVWFLWGWNFLFLSPMAFHVHTSLIQFIIHKTMLSMVNFSFQNSPTAELNIFIFQSSRFSWCFGLQVHWICIVGLISYNLRKSFLVVLVYSSCLGPSKRRVLVCTTLLPYNTKIHGSPVCV